MPIDPIDFIAIIFIVFIVVFCVIAMIRGRKRDKTYKQQLEEELKKVPKIDETIHVEVVDQKCFVTSEGTKLPKTAQNFVIFFQDDHGEILKIPVEEDIYDAFEIGQVGKFTLIGGRVQGFVLDEQE